MCAPAEDQNATTDWQDDVFRVLKQHDVRHVAYVPDAATEVAECAYLVEVAQRLIQRHLGNPPYRSAVAAGAPLNPTPHAAIVARPMVTLEQPPVRQLP
jgi:hypothetical protein